MRRLGLDIGTNSIGWCLTEDDARVVDIGVRIFSDGRDPQSGTSLAVDRRDARAARRRRDRFIGRRDAFLNALVEHGLMPHDADERRLLADLDPYSLRARALTERLEPHEIGRALFHLNQRRGFKSNRKAERKTQDSEDGKIASGARALDGAMAEAGADTLGAFLHGQEVKRVRMDSEAQAYDFYPQRRHYEYEFGRIWEEQAKHHPALLTETARAALHRILFFQRPLKQQEVGVCTFAGWGDIPADEPRLPKSHPLFQERRLYEEVNHLEITTPGEAPRKLTLDQRDRLIRVLKAVKRPSYATLGKEIGLQPGQSFNKASETRTHMLGDEVHAAMADKKLFGKDWANLSSERQRSLVNHLLNEENPEVFREVLIHQYGLTEQQVGAAEQAASALPEGYGRLGLTATRAVLDQLKRYIDGDGQVITYDKAVEYGLKQHHSDRRDKVERKKLEYYGEVLGNEIAPAPLATDPLEKRWGKITNPTVHIGLRQLEKLINALIRTHGRPDEIVVELARELKLNERDKEEHNKRIRRDTAAAQKRSQRLSGLDAEGERVGEPVAADTGANRMLLRMWEELNPGNPLDRRCPYCAKSINIEMLFGPDAEADVDHIIPYSRSLDDSAGNKVVAHRSCNRAKGNQTPYEKWGEKDPNRWELISAQVARMHRSKQWRFGPDAMERVEKDDGFLARQLTDTQYLSRLAGRYLSSLYTPDEGRRVYVIPGKMTAMLRRLWALNDVLDDSKFVENRHSNAPKNRLDHRHHAIDGFVCSVTSQSLLMRIAEAAGRAEHKDLDRMFEGLPEPWPGYLPELRGRLLAVTVSHKPDHGRRGKPKPGRDVTAGRLHNDTAYGFTGDTAADGRTPIVVHRVPLSSLKPADITGADRIADPALRDALRRATEGLTGKDYERALARFARDGSGDRDKNGDAVFKGTRRVRVREPLNVIAVRDGQGRAYKGYKGDSNARFDVWRMPDGKWVPDVVSTFDAHRPDAADRRPHPAAKKMLSLRQNDMLAIERDGGPREVVRVVKFSTIGTVALARDNEAGPLKARDATPNDADPFKYVLATAGGLRKHKARQVRIDPLGRLFDPGPR